jgi:hypothetical protein
MPAANERDIMLPSFFALLAASSCSLPWGRGVSGLTQPEY